MDTPNKPSQARSEPTTAGFVVANIFRYCALIVLVGGCALAAPLWGLTAHLLDGLTNQATYEKFVTQLEIGQMVTGSLVTIEDLLPAEAMAYLNRMEGEGPSIVDELNESLGEEVNRALSETAGQIPAYIGGRIDHLTGSLQLMNVKKKAVDLVVKRTPGGALLSGFIKEGADRAIPDSVPLTAALSKIEMLLAPIRAAVTQLRGLIETVGRLALLALLAIALVSFHLIRALRWVGVALVVSATTGVLLGEIIGGVLTTVLPQVVSDNALFKGLLSDSIASFAQNSYIWLAVGGGLIVASIVLQVGFSRRLSGKPRGAPSGVLRFLLPGKKRANLLTAISFPVAMIVLALTPKRNPMKIARCALGGACAAAILLDGVLIMLVIGVIAGGTSPGFLAKLAVAPLWLVMLLFWSFRDRLKTMGGFNFVDRLCGIKRGRALGKRATCGSFVRSLPLIAVMVSSLFVPLYAAVAVAIAVDTVFHLILWPDRALGDLIAGTRARLKLS